MRPATPHQIARLRELSEDARLPQPAAVDHVARKIAEGLTEDAAYDLLRALGGRIRNARQGA